MIPARLAAQAVTVPLPRPEDVVRRLLAMQAQDHAQATWAVGLRCGATLAEVEDALARRAVVRTWTQRGTLHLVAAEDARWMVELLGPRVLASTARRRAQLELDAATLARARRALEPAVAAGPLSRAGAMATLEAAGVRTAGQRGYHVLFHLSLERVLVQVGKDLFAAFDDVIPPAPPLPREEALPRLASRYLAGHGPATAQDLAWWAGIGLGDARAGLADASVVASGEVPDPGVHLLPGYDELLLGYRDRSAILDPAHADRVCPGGNGVFRPTVLVGGRMVATWRARRGRGAVAIDVEPFDAPVDAEALRPAAERHAAFLGLPLAD